MKKTNEKRHYLIVTILSLILFNGCVSGQFHKDLYPTGGDNIGEVELSDKYWIWFFISPTTGERERRLNEMALQVAREKYGSDVELADVEITSHWHPYSLILYFSTLGFVEQANLKAKVIHSGSGQYKFSERERKAIREKKIFVGMSRASLLLSWGNPDRINRSVGRFGVHEQFVYGPSKAVYVYVENDYITSWQD